MFHFNVEEIYHEITFHMAFMHDRITYRINRFRKEINKQKSPCMTSIYLCHFE